MKKCLLGLALLAGLSSVSRNASAESALPTSKALADALTVVVLTAVDVPLTAVDGSFLAQRTWAPVPYGIIEFMVATLQFGVCLDKATSTGAGVDPTPVAVGAALGAVFMVHGIVTIVRPGSHHEAPPAPVTVAPVALSDTARTSVPGLAVLGRF